MDTDSRTEKRRRKLVPTVGPAFTASISDGKCPLVSSQQCSVHLLITDKVTNVLRGTACLKSEPDEG